MGGYLVYTIPRLSRLKRLPEDLKPDIKKQLIHDTPKKWSKTFMEITGRGRRTATYT
jgi:1-acyl-sn-glycerol-3-phosphate acyltransferase